MHQVEGTVAKMSDSIQCEDGYTGWAKVRCERCWKTCGWREKVNGIWYWCWGTR